MNEFPNFKLKFRFYRTRRATRGRKLTINWTRDGERKKVKGKIRIRTTYGKSFNRRKFSRNSIIIIKREKKEERTEIERRRKKKKRNEKKSGKKKRLRNHRWSLSTFYVITVDGWTNRRTGHKINMLNRNYATNAYHVHSS